MLLLAIDENGRGTGGGGAVAARAVASKLADSDYHYDEGDCGDLVRTMMDFDPDAEPVGVLAYDGSVAHAAVKSGDDYYDGKGVRDEDEIKGDWAYDRPVDMVEFVPLKLEGDKWTYKGKPVMSAERSPKLEAMLEEEAGNARG